jgi:hypothetical protein
VLEVHRDLPVLGEHRSIFLFFSLSEVLGSIRNPNPGQPNAPKKDKVLDVISRELGFSTGAYSP